MADYDIAAAFEAIENELIDSMMKNFARHRAEENKEGYLWSQWQAEQLKSLERYRRQNEKKLAAKFSQLNGKVADMLRRAKADGSAAQEADILQAIQGGFKGYAESLPNSPSATFFRLNDRKLDALIKATTDDLKSAETAILRMSNDRCRKAVFNAQVYANTGAATYEKAVDMACRDMLRAGLNCVEYKNGARHTLSDYAHMAIRTANKRAYLYGEGQKRQQWGISTVVVNGRRGGCPLCTPYIGKVFIDDVYSGGKRDVSSGKAYPLLSEAIKSGLFHPNCKDSTSTYYEGITTLQPVTEEEQAEMERREQLEAKESYYKNEAKKNRRIAKYSLDADNKRTYSHRAEVFEQKAQNAEKALANFGESGIINLFDNSTDYKPVTQEAIDSVPLLNVFDDDAMNKAHQEACRDLLREVRKHDELPLGTEFSIVYDENMQPIRGCGYRQGEIGKTKIDNPGVPYHAFHNHGSGQTFSIPDILNFAGKENMISLSAVGNNGDLYLLISTSMSDKQSYFDYLTVSFNDIIFKTDKREVTLNWLYSSNNSKIVDEYIHSLNPKQKNQLIFAVLDKVNEYLIGAEKFGIKYIKT